MMDFANDIERAQRPFYVIRYPSNGRVSMNDEPHIDRRTFLTSVATVGGSLALGFGIPFDATRTNAATADQEITAWVVIKPDDTVIIRIAKSEMGQGSS